MYFELHAYQHHVFMDWRFAEGDEKWTEVLQALNGAGVDSMQAKWDEMFGVKEKEVVDEEVKVRKPRRKKAAGKKTITTKRTSLKAKYAVKKIEEKE